jgi:hypothetical protein
VVHVEQDHLLIKAVRKQPFLQTVPQQEKLLQALSAVLHHDQLYDIIFSMSENVEINEEEFSERVFALVSDGEVFHKWYVKEKYDDHFMAALIYGLQSQPTIVDITDKNFDEINFGWTFDGQEFLPPENLGG